MVPTKLTNIQRAAAQPGVQAHGEGESVLLWEPVAAPDAGAVEEVRRHGSGHEPVEEVGMAEAAGHDRRSAKCLIVRVPKIRLIFFLLMTQGVEGPVLRQRRRVGAAGSDSGDAGGAKVLRAHARLL